MNLKQLITELTWDLGSSISNSTDPPPFPPTFRPQCIFSENCIELGIPRKKVLLFRAEMERNESKNLCFLSQNCAKVLRMKTLHFINRLLLFLLLIIWSTGQFFENWIILYVYIWKYFHVWQILEYDTGRSTFSLCS